MASRSSAIGRVAIEQRSASATLRRDFPIPGSPPAIRRPFTLLRLCPAPGAQLNLLLAYDERGEGGGRMQSLEPAFDYAFASYAPRATGATKPFSPPREFSYSKISPVRCACLRRLRRCLVPPGFCRRAARLGRLTHDTALVARRHDKIANNDEARGNPDPHPTVSRPAQRTSRAVVTISRPARIARSGVVLMCLRVRSKPIPVAHILGDKAIESGHHPLNVFVVVADHFAQVFQIEP